MKKIGLFNVNLDIDYLKKKILKEEKKIIKKYPPVGYDNQPTDGETGLGLDSLTSRYYHFNVLNWDGTEQLAKEIKRCYNTFTESNQDIYVQCWANVMRCGQKINPHKHNYIPERNIISGNLVIHSNEMNTYYEGSAVPNKISSLTLFPGTVYHWTDTYEGQEERITIAFDIRTYKDWKEDIFDDAKSHWVKL